MFDEHRNKASHEKDRLKCTASELLGIYAIFRHWVETNFVDQEGIVLESASLFASFAVIDVILEAKRGIVPMAQSAQALRRAIKNHLEAHLRAYGKEDLKPKHHWLWDIAEQWLTSEYVIDAFIIERIHLRAKDACNPVANTSSFEESVLANHFLLHRKSITSSGFENSLVGHQQTLPTAPGIRCADGMTLWSASLRIQRGDFVTRLPEGTVAEVAACLEEGGELYAILVAYRKTQRVSSSASTWQRAEEHILAKAASLQACVAWYWRQRDVVTVLER